MKLTVVIIVLFFSLCTYSQNITVDSQTYTPQQLIEDILIDSDCITNISVSNVVGGNFSNTDQSYGYFDATGTNFPFQNGIVLSTGRLVNVPGPNNSLSDDNADGWQGDLDLEYALSESGTINATILEFDFTAVASQVSFRYIFASEEYQENNPSSCQYSDLFGFLIRPTAGQNQYENIALVPDTYTPVKATTVTPGVQGSCPPQNETYFGSYNGIDSPINFNGQTAILTATANVIANQSYHVKLVIADVHNYRYDSAVFLEGGSFQLSSDLGPSRLIATGNAACEGEEIVLDANQPVLSNYAWYKDGVLQETTPNCFNCGNYTITESGTYSVEVTILDDCISYGEIVVEYDANPVISNTNFVQCDIDMDGLTTYNLSATTLAIDITNANNNVSIIGFYTTRVDAEQNTNPIQNTESFENSIPNQIVFARVENQSGCHTISEVTLTISNAELSIPPFEACEDETIDGITTFQLNILRDQIALLVPADATIIFYKSLDDALNNGTQLGNTIQNTNPYSEIIYTYVFRDNGCYTLFPVELNVLETPQLLADEDALYCLNTFPDTITLQGGVINDLPNNYYYEWLLNGSATDIDTSFINVNEPGNYTVIITDPNGCSASRTITVNPSSTATIESVTIEGVDPNNTVTINVSGNNNYEFTLDNENGIYQESNIFTNVTKGFHTVHVRDRNGCGTVEETISVLGFPKFFTPNNDGDHDIWAVIGTSTQFNSIETVQIFNRFGKLISIQTAQNEGWDGTFNGIQLPSDDYWFIAKFLNGKTFTGHFALRR
jgi:gliding motility-associated-like protein